MSCALPSSLYKCSSLVLLVGCLPFRCAVSPKLNAHLLGANIDMNADLGKQAMKGYGGQDGDQDGYRNKFMEQMGTGAYRTYLFWVA